ncbi:MAG: hypothetical protein VX589_10205 [Myxococcota bacterium]|nr:hypothetical protein [Myxococcota bacterium]
MTLNDIRGPWCMACFILCASCVSDIEDGVGMDTSSRVQTDWAGQPVKPSVIDASQRLDEMDAMRPMGGQTPLIINIDQLAEDPSTDAGLAGDLSDLRDGSTITDAESATIDGAMANVRDALNVPDASMDVDGIVPPLDRMPDSVSSTAYGGDTREGQTTNDQCEAGWVLTGVRGALMADTPEIGRLNGVCGQPIVDSTGNVSVTGVELLPVRGGGRGQEFALTCPLNEAVIGFTGRRGARLENIQLKCARLQMDGNYLMPVAPSFTMPVGTDDGRPFEAIQCPGRELAVGTLIRSSSAINALALICDDLRP